MSSTLKGAAKRPAAIFHCRLATKVSRQYRHQRRTVRTLTAKVAHRRLRRSGVGPSRKTGMSSTNAPKNTFRPRNLSDGGVARRRHAAQQKLSRTANSAPSPEGPPRGFRR